MSKKSQLLIMSKDDYETIATNVNKQTKKIIREAKRDARKFGAKAGLLYMLMKL